MDRRTYLGVLTAAVAGCSGAGDDTDGSGGEPAPTHTTSPPTYETSTDPASASFQVVSLSAPETIAVGETYQFEFTVENTGSQDGVFRSPLSVREPGGQWHQTDSVFEVEVPAGEQITYETGAVTFDYMQELEFRLDAVGRTWSLRVISKVLSFGESYQNPDEIRLTVSDPAFQEQYDYSIDQYSYTAAPSTGKKWLLVTVRAENQAGKPALAPLHFDFATLVNNSQFDATSYRRENEAYDGGEIQAGVVREGKVLFEVPADITVDDIQVVWSDTYFEGDVAVYWSEGGKRASG